MDLAVGWRGQRIAMNEASLSMASDLILAFWFKLFLSCWTFI
jgi:hypothetical protein